MKLLLEQFGNHGVGTNANANANANTCTGTGIRNIVRTFKD